MNFTPILIWWLVVFIFGLVGWPLTFSLLRALPDRGFTFARPVGLLVSGYILWLGASFRLLQNNVGGIFVAMALVLAIGLVWHQRQVAAKESPRVLVWLKKQWRYALATELLFGVAFVAWAIYKSHNPNIETAGGEKWMEIAFINGILRSNHFPPQDPWLSGFGISYYYFGYVLMAMITRLTGLVSTVAFNLYVPTLFAMTLLGAFGIVANLVNLSISRGQGLLDSQRGHLFTFPVVATALVAALFVGFLGNLIGVLEVVHKRGLLSAHFWRWLDIRDLKMPPAGPGNSWIPDRFIWWWRGSRVLTDYNLAGHEQEVIDEFPFFSFLLGDVHPHVLALPFVLLVTALALNLLVNRQDTTGQNNPNTKESGTIDKLRKILENSWRELSRATAGKTGFVLYAICVGALSFLNTWDFPIYLSVAGLALTVRLAQEKDNWGDAFAPAIIGTGFLGATGVFLYLPFYATFQSQARGILPNLWNPTRLPQFFVFWGPFLVAVVGLLLVLSTRNNDWKKQIRWTVPLTILGPLLLMLTLLLGVLLSSAGREYIQGVINNPDVQAVIGASTVGALVQASLARRLVNPWTFLVVGGLLGWALALGIGLITSEQKRKLAGGAKIPKQDKTVNSQPSTPREASLPSALLPVNTVEQFVLILLFMGLALPLAVEFIYLRDNFGIRMNTVFKFYFQAWVLLALVSAFSVYYVSTCIRGVPKLLWQLAMLLLVAGGMIYPVLAMLNKTNNFQNQPTLNGIEWVQYSRPGDYAAIAWLQENAPNDAVILEAPGSGYAAYQYTGRVSALTGLPTLLGWGGHQSQWRGNYQEPARREPDIETLFNTPDLRQAQSLLDKYNITYVYVGPLEQERYAPQGLDKFGLLMNVAFQQDDVVIYQR